jgi:hypothetical protein
MIRSRTPFTLPGDLFMGLPLTWWFAIGLLAIRKGMGKGAVKPKSCSRCTGPFYRGRLRQ